VAASAAASKPHTFLGGAFARLAGNVVGLFHDGDTLEWPVCTAIALIAVAVTVGLFSRR
jgi:hypothetical protein